MTEPKYRRIIELIRREVVPAVGCTEPVAVALCVARAREVLGTNAEAVEIALSANVYKNAMGVGIPNTGMSGLPIAAALGATCCDSADGLEILGRITPQQVEQAQQFLDCVPVKIGINHSTDEILYIEATLHGGGNRATAVIAGGHTRFIRIERNGVTLFEAEDKDAAAQQQDGEVELTLRQVYDFATTAKVADIEFLGESARMNLAAADISFAGDYGHGLGRMLHLDSEAKALLGDTLFTQILAATSGACDVRMGGAQVAVMSNSGSGNQGISATVPVALYAQAQGAGREQLLRALALSHLTVIYIKQSLGRLSALCGCVVAATGSSCGITYLMGGRYEEVTYAVKNMIANITGMICDGAKPACSLKVTSGVATAVLAAMLAVRHRHAWSSEGIVNEDADECIRNLTAIGRYGMRETDKLILKIMTEK